MCMRNGGDGEGVGLGFDVGVIRWIETEKRDDGIESSCRYPRLSTEWHIFFAVRCRANARLFR